MAVEQQTLIPQIQIRSRSRGRGPVRSAGGPTNELLETALNGRVVSQAVDETKRIDLVVRLDEPYRNDVAALKGLLVDGQTATKVPLASIATVTSASGPNQILRENALRRIVVQCNTAGRDLGSVIDDIQRTRRDDRLTLEPGYFIEYGGQFESQQQATRLIGLALPGFDSADLRRPLRPLPVGPACPADHGQHPAGDYRRRHRHLPAREARCRWHRWSVSSRSPGSAPATAS